MNTFLWVAGVLVVLVVAFFVYVFGSMIFISQITQLKVRSSPEYELLVEGITIKELPHDEPPADREEPNTGDHEGGREMLLFDDGSLKEGRRTFDSDPGKEVIVSFNPVTQTSILFIDNDVFESSDGRRGQQLGSFSEPGFSYIDYVLSVSDKYFLVNGSMETSPYPSERELWQVAYDGLSKTRLSDKPYYTFSRPPKVFVFEKSNEQVVVYYVDSYDYGFGGDASRPKTSVVRVYNSRYPQGRDIAHIGFKAGTVIDVERGDDGYLLITDPSLPTMAGKPRVSFRKWQIVVD